MCIYHVTTAREIEQEYGLPVGSVRRDLSRGKFRKSEVRKSGSTWLITKREAARVYKNELTLIPVINDWEWALQHVREELENPVMDELVRKVLHKPFMNDDDVKNLASIYFDGMRSGLDNGKYLPFAQWFYEFYEYENEN